MTDARTETIRFRAFPAERERYETAAGGARRLSEWLRQAADEKAARDGISPQGSENNGNERTGNSART